MHQCSWKNTEATSRGKFNKIHNTYHTPYHTDRRQEEVYLLNIDIFNRYMINKFYFVLSYIFILFISYIVLRFYHCPN